eukprot:14183389-Alexandrium_andersonii.AAC.1
MASVLAFLAVYAGIKYINKLFREPEPTAWPTAPMQDPLLQRGRRDHAAQADTMPNAVPEPPKQLVTRDATLYMTYSGD